MSFSEKSADDLAVQLRERLLIEPRDIGAILDLAGLLEQGGDLPGAIDLYQRALRVDPYLTHPLTRLGALWAALGDTERARHWFGRALAVDPDNAAAADGLEGLRESGGLTDDYIRTLFDQYAARFDADLTGTLNYRAPALVAAALARCGVGDGSANILDLGCGTGLSGLALRRLAARLEGVDLSPRMVEKAIERGIYSSLAVSEALAFLEQPGSGWDIVAAVDMLNYVGDLGPIFAASARRLEPGGILAGTLERRDEGGVGLTKKRRYAHGADHLKTLAQAARFVEVELSDATLRTEGGVPVAGLIFVLRRI